MIFSLWPSSVTRTKVGPARRVRPSLRATDVSPRSSPLRDVSRGGTSATQRQKIHTDDVNQCLHSHGVPNAKLFLLAKRSSAAMSEEKRLPFAGYWGATLPPQKSDPARRINLLAEPTFFCKQLATLAYGSDHFFFTPELIDPQDGLGLYNLVSRAFPFSLALSFGRDWHLWRARQEPITWSMQLPYLAYAKAFSHISLFVAPFGSTFRREIGSTVPYECASILIGRQ